MQYVDALAFSVHLRSVFYPYEKELDHFVMHHLIVNILQYFCVTFEHLPDVTSCSKPIKGHDKT